MKYLLLLPLIVLLSSCSSHDKMKNEVDVLLKRANQNFIQDKNNNNPPLDSAYSAIENFVKKYPNDTLSPAYLFEESLLQEKQRKYDEVITTLERIYSTYPNSKQAGKSLFLEGFLYANVLKQLDKAKEKYQLYLDKYSQVDPKVTQDVQMELQNLGKSPEEILQQIEEKARQDSVQVPS